ncbi:TonB-dependent receptor [Asticcacaulis sp. 201]|uniref:TonB-dependent receptor n=1 Tax=Asticcacaulis sp. 201 TaxID=3028787 RepID=UPI002916A37A|nr:TonB-dependent receptor [Asticcacaulis sp. 201]MDV6331193.1 TonB-dependent receptor [Asticcacaulis sp. 201]
MYTNLRHRTLRTAFLTTTLLATAMGAHAYAQEAKPQDNTDVSDEQVKTVIIRAERSRAAATSPSKASLDQGEPQSIVSRPFIETSTPETGDFTTIANITPSAASAGSNNGPGFGESKVTLRGFKDGNYNVTFEGIPWGDSNNPTHHSNSFFPASTVGAVIVDRGPGSVGDIGQANYGGNIKMFSNKVADDFGVTLRETVGSWNSWQSVAVVQTGKIKALHDLAGFVNIQMNGSDGAQTYSSMHSGNATTKWTLPISETWNFTVFAMYNANLWHVSDNPGSTQAQTALYCKDFALSNDPTKATYYGYNQFNKHTVFSYAKLGGDLPAGFKLENTTYNIYYDNTTNTATNLSSADGINNSAAAIGAYVTNSLTVNGVATKNKPSNPNDILGYEKKNHYMTLGNITRVNRDFGFGVLHTGLWLETSSTNRHTYDYDATLGRTVFDYREKPVCLVYNGVTCKTTSTDALLNYKSYEERSSWWQVQTFADFEWHVTDALTITPGIKAVSMKRNVNADVIKSPRMAQNAGNKNTKTLSNLSVNYKLAKNWSVYGQFAEGMYMPDIAALYVINAASNSASPSLSTNYQLGTVYQSHHVAVDVDVYRIDLTNLLAADSAQNTYINIGKAKASGLEGQVSYAFDNGVTLFANGSSNRYIDAVTRLQVSGAPLTTTGLGALYHRGQWSGSLLYKQVGKQYADNAQAVPINAFDTVDLSVNYEFGRYRIKAQINNLMDNRDLTGLKTDKTSALLNTYTYLVGRNAQLTLIAKF